MFFFPLNKIGKGMEYSRPTVTVSVRNIYSYETPSPLIASINQLSHARVCVFQDSVSSLIYSNALVHGRNDVFMFLR
jgi:hypothetical protein